MRIRIHRLNRISGDVVGATWPALAGLIAGLMIAAPADAQVFQGLAPPTTFPVATSGQPNSVATADLNGDGKVDGADLGLLLLAWDPAGANPPSPADLDMSGAVDGADLGLLLLAWDP